MVVDQWPQYLITKSVNTNAIPKFLGKLNIAVADSETRSWGDHHTFCSGGGSMALICYYIASDLLNIKMCRIIYQANVLVICTCN